MSADNLPRTRAEFADALAKRSAETARRTYAQLDADAIELDKRISRILADLRVLLPLLSAEAGSSRTASKVRGACRRLADEVLV